MDEMTLQSIAEGLYTDYNKLLEYLNILEEDKWCINDFIHYIKQFEDNFKDIYTQMNNKDFGWCPYDFNLCLHEYEKEGCIYFIDICVSVSDLDYDHDGWLVSAITDYSILYNDPSLPNLIEINETEEERINRIIYGDPADESEDFLFGDMGNW